MEMSGLMRDGRTEPASRDQFLRRERGQGKMIFPSRLTTSRIAATIIVPVDAQPAERDSILLHTHEDKQYINLF